MDKNSIHKSASALLVLQHYCNVKVNRRHVGESGWETRVPDSSKRLTAHAEFAKRGLVTKHVRTKLILLLKHALQEHTT